MSRSMPISAIFAAIFVNILWGANPVAVKFGLEAFPPLWSAFIRFAIGVLCIALWARTQKVALWPEKREWPSFVLLAVLFAVQITVMNIGFNMTTGAVASVLTATFPLFAAITAHYFMPGDRLSRTKVAGLACAFIGVAMIILRGLDSAALGWGGLGALVILVHAAMLGGRLIYTAKLVRGMEPIRVVLWQMILALPLFAAGALAFETVHWDKIGPAPIAGLIYQGVVIAGLGFMINAYLFRRYSPTLLVSFGFVSPIAGVLLSLWLLSESLNWAVAAGVLGVGLGLIIITRDRPISDDEGPDDQKRPA